MCKLQRHCLRLRGKRRDVEWGFRPQAFKYFPFLSTFCIFPFLKMVLIAAPQTPPPLQESVGALGTPAPLLSLVPSLVELLPGLEGWPHPLINVSKYTAVNPTVPPPTPGTCPEPSAHCFGIGTSFGCHRVSSGFSQCLPRGQKRTWIFNKKDLTWNLKLFPLLMQYWSTTHARIAFHGRKLNFQG